MSALITTLVPTLRSRTPQISMDAPQYLNLADFAYWPITKQISWWFCFYVNWTQIQQ